MNSLLPRTAAVFVVLLVLLAAQSTYWVATGEQLYGGALYWPTLAGWVLASIACMIALATADLARRIEQASDRAIGERDLTLGRAVLRAAEAQIPEPPSPTSRRRLHSVASQGC